MIGNHRTAQNQLSLFGNSLIQLLNPSHLLIKLGEILPWEGIEEELSPLYSRTGAPSHPIRKMVGLLLLQNMYNLSDRAVVTLWKENPYYQYFTGESQLQWEQPCAASDLTHFRQRLGEKGVRALFKMTLDLHGEEIKKAQEVIVDTTVQEKHITYPTDAKLYKKVIDKCVKLAGEMGIKLRQSYRYVVKKLMYVQRYMSHPKHWKEAKKAIRKLKTIAGRQVRDLSRSLEKIGEKDHYAPLLATMEKIIVQEKTSKDKIYSLHETEVSCIAKGKAGKKYEYGSKVSIASLPGSQIIVGMENYPGNPHDSQTIVDTLDKVEKATGKRYERVLVDRGYRGTEKMLKEEVILPGTKGLRKGSYQHRIHKERCRKPSAIEALISHLKNYHKLGRNYLKGRVGDVINSLLTAVGHNLQLLMVKVSENIFLYLLFATYHNLMRLDGYQTKKSYPLKMSS